MKRYLSFLVFISYSCSTEIENSPVRELKLIQKEVKVIGSNNSLIEEMFNYNYFTYPPYLDDFCRLNPAHCELTKLSGVPKERYDIDGWHYEKSRASGKVYKYLMRKEDEVILPYYMEIIN